MLTLSSFRDKVQSIEKKLESYPDSVYGDNACPLKHSFAGDQYIRKIFMKKGLMIVSKIHKHEHAFFVMTGDVSVLTEDGVERIKAPYCGITKIGTKRVLYIHEDTVWVTVHTVGEERDLEKIEERVIAKDFIELDDQKLIKDGAL
jgi:hypothetical protein